MGENDEVVLLTSISSVPVPDSLAALVRAAVEEDPWSAARDFFHLYHKKAMSRSTTISGTTMAAT